jgi:hypothetical protein
VYDPPSTRLFQYSIVEDRFIEHAFDRSTMVSSIAYNKADNSIYGLTTGGQLFQVDIASQQVENVDAFRGSSIKPFQLVSDGETLIGYSHGGKGAAVYLYPEGMFLGGIEARQDVGKPPEIFVFPNPVSVNTGMVSISGAEGRVECIQLFTLSGQLHSRIEEHTSFSVPRSSGVYFVRVVLKSGQSATRLLMVR